MNNSISTLFILLFFVLANTSCRDKGLRNHVPVSQSDTLLPEKDLHIDPIVVSALNLDSILKQLRVAYQGESSQRIGISIQIDHLGKYQNHKYRTQITPQLRTIVDSIIPSIRYPSQLRSTWHSLILNFNAE